MNTSLIRNESVGRHDVTNDISSNPVAYVYILDDGQTYDVMFITFCVIFLVAAFGFVTCVINAAIFFRLGFKDTVNISLFALALSDLCTMMPLFWVGVLSVPRFLSAEVDFIGMDVQALTGSWPHTCFTRIASWITTYTMFERCLCVVAPLTVKILLTPLRVKCILVSIVALNFAGVVPTYCTYGLGWKFVPERNRTLLGFQISGNAYEVTRVSHLLNNPVSAISSFIITIFCMLIIAEKLSKKQMWRIKISGAGSGGVAKSSLSSKDGKAVKLVIIVSAVFLISVTPSVCLNIVNIVDVQFNLHGGHRNILYVSYTFSYLLEALNACSNIIIYYLRNSRYRKKFRVIFRFY